MVFGRLQGEIGFDDNMKLVLYDLYIFLFGKVGTEPGPVNHPGE